MLFLQSCYYDNFTEIHPGASLANLCDSTKSVVSYANDIVPILNNSCGTTNACHNAPSLNNNNVDLSNYLGVQSQTAGYTLYHVVQWTPNYSKMPKGSQTKISDCNIALIRKWIDAGAPNN
jgi:hypothetical protein